MYDSLGCWADNAASPAVTSLEGQDARLVGDYWSRPDAVQLCFEAARDAGYPGFAVQNGGLCSGAMNVLDAYNQYGESTLCENGAGGRDANNVYKINCLGQDNQPGEI